MTASSNQKKTKVCYILSYRSPHYIRTQVLLASLKKLDNIETLQAININTSIIRYIETLYKVLKIRLMFNPDVYILGFRGQEIYWPVKLILIGKPIIFDEFVNMDIWFGEGHHKFYQVVRKAAYFYEKLILKNVNAILTDTSISADYSSKLYRLPRSKYHHLYVGANEDIFYPTNINEKVQKNLRVFFYGNMLPLHGINYILQAAQLLKDENIEFQIVGGRGNLKIVKNIKNFINTHKLTNISYAEWVDFEDMPKFMALSDLVLGGPFGNTKQSKLVITGKTFQSLACGKATLIGDTDEQVGFKNKINCLVVKQGSADSLANQIRWALRNRARLKSIGENGFKLYTDKFSVKSIAPKIQEIINEIAT